MVRTYQI